MVLLYYILVDVGTNLASSKKKEKKKIGKPFDFKTGYSLRKCQILEKENVLDLLSYLEECRILSSFSFSLQRPFFGLSKTEI